jgi:hypothetical protein
MCSQWLVKYFVFLKTNVFFCSTIFGEKILNTYDQKVEFFDVSKIIKYFLEFTLLKNTRAV